MASNWLLVAEAASLRLPSDGLWLHIVELAATYLVQSTLFLAVGWALLPVLSWICSMRKTKPDGQERPSYGVSPALTERLWKLAAVLALVTAPLSVFTGWSRPAWEWSLLESPSPAIAVVRLRAALLEPTLVTESLVTAAIRSRPALPEELAALDNGSSADRPIADEPTAEFLPLVSATSPPGSAQWRLLCRLSLRERTSFRGAKGDIGQPVAQSECHWDSALDQRVDTVFVVIEPAVIRSSPVEAPADSHPAPASRPTAEVEPLRASIHWLGILLVAWVAWSALRLVRKSFALRRRLARCEPIGGALRHELNRLVPRGRAVRLLRSGPLAPGFAGESDCV